MLVAVYAAAVRVGEMMQNEAHAGAPWEDRSGHARSGIFYAVEGFGLGPEIGQIEPGAAAKMTDTATVSGSEDRLVITLGHTVFYGKYLELSHGGKYAIIMSTVEGNLGNLERLLKGLLE
jgi:hypothetical protein